MITNKKKLLLYCLLKKCLTLMLRSVLDVFEDTILSFALDSSVSCGLEPCNNRSGQVQCLHDLLISINSLSNTFH